MPDGFFFPNSEILNQEGLCVSLEGRQSCSLPHYLINMLQTESGLAWPFLHRGASASWCGGSCCHLCNLCVRAHSCKRILSPDSLNLQHSFPRQEKGPITGMLQCFVGSEGLQGSALLSGYLLLVANRVRGLSHSHRAAASICSPGLLSFEVCSLICSNPLGRCK